MVRTLLTKKWEGQRPLRERTGGSPYLIIIFKDVNMAFESDMSLKSFLYGNFVNRYNIYSIYIIHVSRSTRTPFQYKFQ